MPAVVLDTNVVLDCWVFGDAAAQPLRDVLEAGRVVMLHTPAIEDELRDVLGRPAFALDTTRRAQVLARWHACGQRVEAPPAPARLRCRDPGDQKFLDLALAQRVRALVSKDKALLSLAARARALGLRVVAPAAAASVLFVEDDAP